MRLLLADLVALSCIMTCIPHFGSYSILPLLIPTSHGSLLLFQICCFLSEHVDISCGVSSQAGSADSSSPYSFRQSLLTLIDCPATTHSPDTTPAVLYIHCFFVPSDSARSRRKLRLQLEVTSGRLLKFTSRGAWLERSPNPHLPYWTSSHCLSHHTSNRPTSEDCR